jgi:LysM repeat protein
LELQSKRRSRLKVAVFCIVAVGVTGLTAMLIQGCKREQNEAENQPPPIETAETTNTNPPPPMEASNPPVTPPPVVTPAPVPSGTEYVVIKGDSLWKIAKKNGVTLKALEEANPGVDAAKLKVGQKLVIPAASNAPEATTGMTGSTGAGGEEIYIVKSGDTLAKIARHYGTTVKAIESENGLSTTRIKVGQKLKIPANAEAAPAAAAAPAPAPAAALTAAGTTSAPDSTPNTQQ